MAINIRELTLITNVDKGFFFFSSCPSALHLINVDIDNLKMRIKRSSIYCNIGTQCMSVCFINCCMLVPFFRCGT
jgi:hypothetical protein